MSLQAGFEGGKTADTRAHWHSASKDWKMEHRGPILARTYLHLLSRISSMFSNTF